MSTTMAGRSPGEGSLSHRFARPSSLSHTQSPSNTPSSKMSGLISGHHSSGGASARYHARASIVIIGMKGSGKTTLGLIANRALGKTLIDADRIFENREEQSIEVFVKARGWRAFREKECAIIKDLLTRYPHDSIIACGGGVVESEDAVRALKEARRIMPVINILREREAILHHLRTLREANTLLDYGEEERQVMRRREPLYRRCSSHTFVNLTCSQAKTDIAPTPRGLTKAVYPLKYKQVGESFLRLIRQVLGDAKLRFPPSSRPASRSTSRPPSPGVSFTNHPRGSISHLLGSHGPGPDVNAMEHSTSNASLSNASTSSLMQCPTLPRKADPTNRASLLTRRTTAVSLTFPDMSKVQPDLLKVIVQGVDAIEVRVDMLACLRPASYNFRSQDPLVEPVVDMYEVARQLELVRRIAPGAPILFTLRSDREGGSFFDDRNRHQRHMSSPFSQALYFQLLDLAIATGVELLDVEMGWDPDLTRKLIERRERTKIVVSYHDLNGALHWETDVPLKLYQRATREFGMGVHLVELIGTASRSHIEQNSHLSSFAAKLNSEAAADRTRSMPPLMALNMGPAGRSSRPFNDVLDFNSHAALPTRAGPGQMSLKETMDTLVRFGVYLPCHFHLVALQDEANLIAEALKISFEECGLPYQLHAWPAKDTVERYILRNKHGGEEDMENTNEDYSNGLFLGASGLADQQRQLFEMMEKRHPSHLTLLARVARAVDVLAMQDVSQSLLGTERGRRVPNALGDVRGPLIGCHTLPASIYRCLSEYTAPINAAGVNASALVVSLKPLHHSEAELAAVEIAARSSLFALAKLGYGDVYLLEEEQGLMEGVVRDVINLVRHSSHDILDDHKSGHESASSDGHLRCHYAAIDVQHLKEPEGKGGSADAFRKPRAIVLVGGSEDQQERAMQTLWNPVETGDTGLMLPRETWETLFGGTILRLPSSSLALYGEQVDRRDGHEVEAGVVWERGGWINVAPWIIERDRVHRGVVEAWSRRGAPVQSMQAGWAQRQAGAE